MLNISPKPLKDEIDNNQFESLKLVTSRKSGEIVIKLLIIFSFGILIILALPWTQNIRSRGLVTTLKPDQRPQTIPSIIAGRIEKWYVQEGDFVTKGDTILFVSEIKDEYFDPRLLERTQEQLKSKEFTVKSYEEKVAALDTQIDALVRTRNLKNEQAENHLKQAYLKVKSDSIEYEAADLNYHIAQERYHRMEKLYEKGLKSLTDLETRKLGMQKAKAEKISKENKLLTSRNEVLNAKVEITSVRAQFEDDIAKARSEKFTALSNMYDAQAVVTKLQNQYMNYEVRTGMYYITAPQNGYITHALQSGIGETVKEGTEIVSIMPSQYDLAVAMYVRPLDLPLLEKEQRVRIQFDGWPAIVFSGWPNTSYGTYGGKIFAIDNFISENGMYRVLVSPDENDHEWPQALRVGAGTSNMILLKDVPIWYELWRQVNGFPPDFYKSEKQAEKK